MPRRNSKRRKLLVEEIRRARLAAGLTQREAAKKAGIPQTLLSKIERGERTPDGFDFALLIDSVKLRLERLLEVARDPLLADEKRDRPAHLRGAKKGAPRNRY